MKRQMDQWWTLGLCLAMGCSQAPDPQEFKTYKELEQQHAAPAVTAAEAAPAGETLAATPSTTDVAPVASVESVDSQSLETPVSALAPANVVDGTSAAAVLNAFPGARAAVVAENTTPAEATTATPAPETRPQGIQLLVPHREFKVEGPQNALRVSYDDLDLLKVLNMEPVPEDALKHFPSWLKALDGQRMRLRGFMYPTFQATGIDQFVLARDNQICCFGRNPKVYDLVSVQMRDGVTTDYIQNRPFDVVGTFRIDLIAEGGKPMGLYWLEDCIIINK